jgi:hypothetical protein
MRAHLIAIALIATQAAAQWDLVITAPTPLTNGLPDDVRITSLISGLVGGGLGKESPARDNYNRLAARGTVPTQYPALVHESGHIIQPADARAITERAARLAAWETSDYPRPDSLVPMIDTNGVSVGLARVLVDRETLEVIAVIDTASPKREWAQQRAAAVALLAARTAEKAAKASEAAAAKASRDKAAADAKAAGTAAASANSVVALRAQVQALAAAVEKLAGAQ